MLGLPLEEILRVASTILQALAVVVTAYFASRSLSAWRRQLVGKRKLEVAEDMLLAAYKGRGALSHVRNPIAFGEGRARPREQDERPNLANLKDSYFTPLARMQALEEDFAQWSKVRFLADAYFGQEGAAPFDAIRKAYATVTISARMLVMTAGDLTPQDPRKVQWEADIWDTGTSDDPIRLSIDAAVRQVETACRPYLTEGRGWLDRVRRSAR